MEETLESLTRIDHQTLFGIPIQQTWTALYMLEKLCFEQKISLVIELGTGNRALSKYFNGAVNKYYGLDIRQGNDVFDPKVKNWVQETINYPWSIISNKTLIFCDDGDKPREIREYAPMLKSGDFILGHDYRRPNGIPENFDYQSLELETYRQDEWDKLVTYILCLRKI